MYATQTLLIAAPEEDRVCLRSMLKGYALLEAQDGARAAALLERESVGLMLLAGELPGKEHLCACAPVPTILVTSGDDPDLVARAYDMGVSEHIGRPLVETVVRRRVANMLLLHSRRVDLSARERAEQPTLRLERGEADKLMDDLRRVFDTVRLVDPCQGIESRPVGEIGPPCTIFWGREGRCENCISRRVFHQRGRMTKLEFTDQDIFQVTAKYVEVDGVPWVLEMIARVQDSILLEGYGKGSFVEKINRYNRERYTDPLTGVYNRRYFEEHLSHLERVDAVAMIDADDFKRVNDTYGHLVGDMALQAVAAAISSCVRDSDALIRYGGDEFLLLFRHIPSSKFEEKLEQIRRQVSAVRLPEYPEIRLSISVGGVHSASTLMDAIRQADRLMYRAKERKNTAVWT